MKRKNRDINVAEWAKIPKFSKLDDIGTPLRLLELSFDDVLVYDNLLHQVVQSYRERRH